ncbi:MAG: hypothetical protein ACE5D8_08125 [Fidelibacterota bacterium]
MTRVRPLTLVLFILNLFVGGAVLVDTYWFSNKAERVPEHIQMIIADHCKICHDRSQTATFFRAEAQTELKLQGGETLNPILPFGDLSQLTPAEVRALKGRIAAMLERNLMPQGTQSFLSDLQWHDDERMELLTWARSD